MPTETIRTPLERLAADGWLHVARLFTRDEVAGINALVDELWRRRPHRVTVDDVDENRRCRFDALSDEHRRHRIKIGDLYLWHSLIRDLLLDARVLDVARTVVGPAPVLCNSLNMELGSAQDYHADSMFMTPATAGQMIACWIALEDVHADAGPLRLYGRSHTIEPFLFSNGSQHAVGTEMQAWGEYVQAKLDAHGMVAETPLPAVGDAIFWVADLVHGAAPIGDRERTRRSMVAHYFSYDDSITRGYRLRRHGRGWWSARLPQPVSTATRLAVRAERVLQRARALKSRVSRCRQDWPTD